MDDKQIDATPVNFLTIEELYYLTKIERETCIEGNILFHEEEQEHTVESFHKFLGSLMEACPHFAKFELDIDREYGSLISRGEVPESDADYRHRMEQAVIDQRHKRDKDYKKDYKKYLELKERFEK
jgi:hypothetical protein